ncbi:MAG TPA: SLATT domain-containing protein [Terracidiphilus sp.]|jgi:hypothetical protein|nr:SLATT domain-containing protein [Terracidiphilus sp.]
MEISAEVMVLITDWFRRVRESQRVHYECGNYFSRLNLLLGVPTIILTAGVGTAVFASLDKQSTGSLKLALGLISIAAAVLSSLQTFLSFAERANRHRITGAKYGAIRRTLEEFKTMPPGDQTELRSALDAIKKAMDDLAENAPHVPTPIKNRVDRELKSRDHKRVFDLPGSPGSENKGRSQ